MIHFISVLRIRSIVVPHVDCHSDSRLVENEVDFEVGAAELYHVVVFVVECVGVVNL